MLGVGKKDVKGDGQIGELYVEGKGSNLLHTMFEAGPPTRTLKWRGQSLLRTNF